MPESQFLAAGHSSAETRFSVVQRIASLLHANPSVDDTVSGLAEALADLVPFDRFSLSLFHLNQWFTFQDGTVGQGSIPITEPMDAGYSVSRWAVLERKPLLRADVGREHRFERDRLVAGMGFRSELAVPLEVDGATVGTFSFRHLSPGRYDQSHLDAAVSVAEMVALVVRDLQMRAYVAGVRDVSGAVQVLLDLNDVIDRTISHIRGQGYDRVRLYLFDETRNQLVGARQVGGEPEADFGTLRVDLSGDPYSQETLSGRRPRIYRRGQLGKGVDVAAYIGTVRHQEWGEIPLFVVEGGNEVFVGKISLDNGLSGLPLQQARLDALMVFASQAALAIRHAQLFGRLEDEVRRRTKELQDQRARQESLLRVGQAVQTMRRPADIAQVLIVCLDELRRFGVKCEALALHRLLDATTETLETVRLGPGGAVSGERRSGRSALTRCWQAREASYVRNIEPGSPRSLTLGRRFGGLSLRSYMNVPFSKGVISAHAALPDAFGPADAALLKEIAETIAFGISRAEDLEKVDQSEARFRRLADAAFEGIVITVNGRVTDANAQFARVIGYGPDEIVGKGIEDLLTPESLEIARRRIAEDYQASYELTARSSTGELLPVEVQGRTIQIGNQKARVTAVRDIRERKRASEEQIRLERLSALGEIAQGVAHNFNNLLVGVLGYAQLIDMESAEGPVREYARQVIRSAERASDLVKRLTHSVRGRREEANAVDVNEAIAEAVATSRPKWADEAQAHGIHIDVVTRPGDVPPIRGSQARLHDVLVNLIFNAVDAMPHGGRITVAASVDGDFVVLRVTDTGKGMDEATRLRAFEPFFTTKLDVGTGLGLSTVRATVTGWGGGIDVDSRPGHGATFVIRLPVWKEAESQAVRRSSEDATARPPGAGRVLIVDDDEEVLTLLSALLKPTHDVRTVSEVEDARAVFLPGAYDVAVIDLGMPRVPGDVLARELREIDAPLATVLMTGWDLRPGDPRLASFDFHLQKPFPSVKDVQDLLRKAIALRQARDRDARGSQLTMSLDPGRDTKR